MSSIFAVPGASRQKLPFVHSDFKPRGKLAKTFGGCSKYSKRKRSNSIDIPDGKLPRIIFNTQEKGTTITFGSYRKGSRKEYAGFVGHSKVLKARDARLSRSNFTHSQNTTIHGALRNESTENNKHPNNICHSSSSHGHSNHSNSGHADAIGDQFPDLDSLFIIDDDDDVSLIADDISTNVGLLQTKDCEEAGDIAHVSFAKTLDDKLKEARGKSGMKREKKKKRKKEKDGSMRALGDVITQERLKELLSPRVILPSLKFAETET